MNIDSRNSFPGVNAAKTPLRQEYLLKTSNAVAALLLSSEYKDFDMAVQESLKNLGQSVKADRAYIWKNIPTDDRLCCIKLFDWDNDPIFQNSIRDPDCPAYDDFLPNWREWLNYNSCINGPAKKLPAPIARFSEGNGARAVLILPIFLKGGFWGFIGFDDRTGEGLFFPLEKEYLRAAGILIAAAIDHHKMIADLIKAKETAQEGAAAKTEFLSRMSHELRTPMNAIIGMNTIARKSGDPEKVAHCLSQIDISSHQLLGIINDILDMSKIEANKFDIETREFDFEKMLENVYNVIHVKMDEKQQKYILARKENFTRLVKSDELRLSQVLTNLLNNAVKFTPVGRSITLSVDCVPAGKNNADEAILHVEVRDTGIGISPDQQERLFNSFEQAEAGTTRKYGGTGLGLAICKKIINLMGGDIRVESELGKGARFIFDIRIAWGDFKKPAAAEPDQNEDFTAAEYQWNDKTILVAEDIEINQEIIQGILEDTGIAIECANNGLEAVKMFEQNRGRYNLILMDIQMPEMNGIDAAAQIRAIENGFKPIPIIAMTANAFSDDVQHCLDAGMNAHLAKPIEVNSFFKVLTQYLNGAGELSHTAAPRRLPTR
ncbi:MAG: response regulator [Treponema sp.]|nr:response regulator [Treponema sp.]